MQTGSVAIRNQKYHIVLDDAYSLMSYVQWLADNAEDELDAISIIEGQAVFGIRQKAVRVKPELEARNTKISGIVQLIAKSPGKGCANMWQISDDMENWTFLPATTKANTKISGLIPASV